MISKFFPAGHLILIFMYKKNINSPPKGIWASQDVSHFSNKSSSTKSTLDSVGQFFLKMMLGGHVWMGK